MYNRFIAIGYVAKDPEFHITQNSEVCNFTFVTNRKYGDDKEEKYWGECVAWGELAEVANSFKKGDLILIEGRLITKEDRVKGSKTRIVAERFRMLKRKEVIE